MVRKVLKKLFRRAPKEPEPERRIEDVRAAADDKLNPSHSDQATQIGMFS
jgi:hypothetical protein